MGNFPQVDSLSPLGWRSRTPSHGQGFSLVELLVALAIVAILISMLLPTLARSRESARQTLCLSRLRQQGQLTMRYVNHNDGQFPGLYYGFNPGETDTHINVLVTPPPYRSGLGTYNKQLLRCPSDQDPDTVPVELADGTTEDWPVSYAHNLQLWTLGLRYWEIENYGRTPSAVAFAFDGRVGSEVQGAYVDVMDFVEETKRLRHFGRLNVLYLDGHAVLENDVTSDMVELEEDHNQTPKGDLEIGGKKKGKK
jgi:prepilin-type N-terminal cleavage/methylation domain-containing protein/prepilin-type processing-associated H-X9-DG protein